MSTLKLLLTHGAGGNRNTALLVDIDARLTEAGVEVVRFDLPFRQKRPHGPPRPAEAAADRAGLREKLVQMRAGADKLFVGGSSYGGRQASMLVSEEPGLVEGLLLLSYPLHPPGKPAQLRTAHLPNISVPTLFVQGVRDPFGSPEEIEAAVRLIPSRTRLVHVAGAGHELKGGGPVAAGAFVEFFLKAD
ncbi:MAG TPA: alpha/beta fold hydrolase [Bryobacteraceae bacterium]|nr:alpha/beta fold hydrolase [Bryobacteraceae bacterium]